MTEPWITDRLPTEADGDCDGDVLVCRRPGDVYWTYSHWTLVGHGLSWRHADSWRPPASRLDFKVGQRWKRRDGEIVKVERLEDVGCWVRDDAGRPWGHREDGTVPSCPDSFDLVELLLPEIKVGQLWRTRDGRRARITQVDSDSDTSFPVRSDINGEHWHYSNGRSCIGGDQDHKRDLVELLEEAPLVPTAPIITATASELICTFEYGGKTYQAVATPAAPTLREQALRLVADYGVANYQFTAAQVATIRAALEAQP